MKVVTMLASIATLALIATGILSVMVPTVHAAPQTVDISSAISGQAQWFTYDSANSLAWISVGVTVSNLYKVDLTSVITSGTGAVTGYTNLLPQTVSGHGSLANGPAAGVICGGSLWVTSWYSADEISIAKISSSGAVQNQFFYAGPTDARAIGCDGTNLIVGTTNRILKMTQAGAFTSLGTTSGSVHDLRIVASTVYFTIANSKAFGKVDLDGSNFQEFNCGVCSTGNLMDKDASGNFWFSDNVAHKLVKFDGTSFTVYDTGFTSDGPYGVCSTSTGLWLNGYANLKTSFFSTSTLAIDSAQDVTTTKKPFQCFKDSSNNVWSLALGSAEITKIPEALSSPSVTTTTTATATVTSVSGTSTTTTAITTTVKTIDDCGGCNLNPTGSAYTIPNGSGTLTIAIVCNDSYCPTKGAWAPAAGGTISASYLCWDASKLTQPCSISPGSFSGTLNSNGQYSLIINSITVGSFNGYYLSGGNLVCCAPQYAPVGYVGSVKFATPFTLWGANAGTASSLPIQFVVAESPTTSKVGGTVYITPPCTWFMSTRACSA